MFPMNFGACFSSGFVLIIFITLGSISFINLLSIVPFVLPYSVLLLALNKYNFDLARVIPT